MRIQLRKGVPVLNFLIGFVISLFIVGIVVSMSTLVTSEMGSTITDSTAQGAINDTRDAIASVSDWLDIVVLMGIVVVILGLIGYLGWTKMSGGR